MQRDGSVFWICLLVCSLGAMGFCWRTEYVRANELQNANTALQIENNEAAARLKVDRETQVQCLNALQLGAKLIESYEERLKMCWVASN